MISRVALAGGVLILAGVWFGPLPALAATSFAAHMTMHVSVVALAAPLLGAGLAATIKPDSLLLRSPVAASVFEFVVVWMWHTPFLHGAARIALPAFIAEQASFVLAGLLLWASAFSRSLEDRGAGVIALLLTSMHMILLGTLLTLASRPLYRHAGMPEMANAALLADQQIGGMLMLLGGGMPYLAAGLYLVWGLLNYSDDEYTAASRSASGEFR